MNSILHIQEIKWTIIFKRKKEYIKMMHDLRYLMNHLYKVDLDLLEENIVVFLWGLLEWFQIHLLFQYLKVGLEIPKVWIARRNPVSRQVLRYIIMIHWYIKVHLKKRKLLKRRNMRLCRVLQLCKQMQVIFLKDLSKKKSKALS